MRITKLFTVALALCSFGSAMAQSYTPLYAGNRTGGTLYEIDTTGMSWTVVTTTSVTSDFGSLSGIYGLATDPTDEQMYALYESSGDESNRRLGIIDPESGSISDIGNAGNLTDIDFGPDGQLFGTTGSSGAYQFRSVDKVTASTTFLFNHMGSSWGPTIGYDPFADEMIYACDDAVNMIDLGTLTESGTGWNPVSECHAFVVLDAETAWIAHYGTMYQMNLTTGSESVLTSPGFNVQALAFGPPPCNEMTIDVSAFELCEGDEVTLDATSETGGTISWTGGVTDEVPFEPGGVGTYEYYVSSDSEDDCEVEDPIVISVLGLPHVIAGAGDLVFCEDEMITLSAAGDADEYVWNDGEELDLMPGIGMHTFNLWGAYTEGGCLGENTDEVTVEVVALPTITASADPDVVCVGLEVTFTGGGGETYMWDGGIIDGEPVAMNEIGTWTYTVWGTDANNCSNSATVDVEVVEPITITAVATDEIEGNDGELNITVSGGASPYTFEWDNGETTEDLTGLDPGSYTVTVVGAGGCETTATFDVGSQLSIEDNDLIGLEVFPNPTTDVVNILLEGTFDYELVAANGDVIFGGKATDTETIDLTSIASGFYFIKVNTAENTAVVKIAKK